MTTISVSKRKQHFNLVCLKSFTQLLLFLLTCFLKNITIGKKQKQGCSIKKGFLKALAKFTGKHLCRVSFLIKLQACYFIKKEALARVFSCEFCEIFKNMFFTERLWTTASKETLFIIKLFVFSLVFYQIYESSVSTSYLIFLCYYRDNKDVD